MTARGTFATSSAGADDGRAWWRHRSRRTRARASQKVGAGLRYPAACRMTRGVGRAVAAVIRVKDYEEALAMANATPFGLSAGIVTTSLKHASHFKRNSESGLVMVNLPTAGLDYHVPFGGRKKSSYGPREQGTYAKDFYTIVKTAYVAP